MGEVLAMLWMCAVLFFIIAYPTRERAALSVRLWIRCVRRCVMGRR
jgi:hypothetical protein